MTRCKFPEFPAIPLPSISVGFSIPAPPALPTLDPPSVDLPKIPAMPSIPLPGISVGFSIPSPPNLPEPPGLPPCPLD